MIILLKLYAELKKIPHNAVCYIVLNLQTQVGARSGVSALALAYRVRSATLSPILRVLAQNRLCSNHEHHRAIILYHKLI